MIKIFIFIFSSAILGCLSVPIVCDPQPGTPIMSPMGEARGKNPGRVVWVHAPSVAKWNGTNQTTWWSSYNTDQKIVDAMLSSAIRSLTTSSTNSQSWSTLFHYFNTKFRGLDRGYKNNEKVVIKINLNCGKSYYNPGNANGLSPQMLKSLLRQLVYEANVPQECIYVYDANRIFVDYLFDPPEGSHEEFPKVHFVDNEGERGREAVVPNPLSNHNRLIFSSTDIPGYNTTLIPNIAADCDYPIDLANFRGHDRAGFTGLAKNFFGSVYGVSECIFPYYNRTMGHWCPKFLHNYIEVNSRPMSTYSPLVDLIGHPSLGQSVLYLSDAIYGGPTEHPDIPIRFQMDPFNGSWTSSLFISQDPIALDSVIFDFIRNEPNIPWARSGCVDNYLHEAAMAHNSPSNTIYNPTGIHPLSSLGVHEHWNDPILKQYSGNLRNNYLSQNHNDSIVGIELLLIHIHSSPELLHPQYQTILLVILVILMITFTLVWVLAYYKRKLAKRVDTMYDHLHDHTSVSLYGSYDHSK